MKTKRGISRLASVFVVLMLFALVFTIVGCKKTTNNTSNANSNINNSNSNANNGGSSSGASENQQQADKEYNIDIPNDTINTTEVDDIDSGMVVLDDITV